jgi:NitT/TauT family transport system substrate-binding protein
VLAFADYGVNTIGMTVIAHNDTIKAKPDLVRRFVRATQRSYEAMIAEPKEAAAAVNRMKKDLPIETLIKTVEESNLVTVAGIPKGKRIGLAEDAEWQLTLDLMKKYREVETSQPATAFYTNEFLTN